MENKLHNSISNDNYFFRCLDEHGINPLDYIDNLSQQKAFLLKELNKLLDIEGRKKIKNELELIRRPIADKLQPKK